MCCVALSLSCATTEATVGAAVLAGRRKWPSADFSGRPASVAWAFLAERVFLAVGSTSLSSMSSMCSRLAASSSPLVDASSRASRSKQCRLAALPSGPFVSRASTAVTKRSSGTSSSRCGRVRTNDATFSLSSATRASSTSRTNSAPSLSSLSDARATSVCTARRRIAASGCWLLRNSVVLASGSGSLRVPLKACAARSNTRAARASSSLWACSCVCSVSSISAGYCRCRMRRNASSGAVSGSPSSRASTSSNARDSSCVTASELRRQRRASWCSVSAASWLVRLCSSSTLARSCTNSATSRVAASAWTSSTRLENLSSAFTAAGAISSGRCAWTRSTRVTSASFCGVSGPTALEIVVRSVCSTSLLSVHRTASCAMTMYVASW
eukprot:Unigene12326_Nuclearia_a/m.37470 Unigene12326_Nuclearia_a/g.37470  ORF Unigene12326_Nuclearia_a/g.37470 Unigene12326_Nuclearia_a/m.37470 type:complete len:384 (+) Unigene12326_Nuclearia_a:430-1581(+)